MKFVKYTNKVRWTKNGQNKQNNDQSKQERSEYIKTVRINEKTWYYASEVCAEYDERAGYPSRFCSSSWSSSSPCRSMDPALCGRQNTEHPRYPWY